MEIRTLVYNASIFTLIILTSQSTGSNIKEYYAMTLDLNECGKTIRNLLPNKELHLIYPSALSRDLNKGGRARDCFFRIRLNKSVKYSNSERNYEAIISLHNQDCSLNLEVYSGHPSLNKALTVLSCGGKPTWQNRIPSNRLYLKFVKKAGLEHVTQQSIRAIVKYSICGDCYRSKWKMNKYEGKDFDSHCDTIQCIDNSNILYYYKDNTKVSLDNGKQFCPTCRSLELDIIESVQICIQTKHDFESLKAKSCGVKVEIDGELALTINIVLWEEYCLPWNLKGKRVKFLFGTSGWNCANNMYSCDVSIVTNATKKNSEKCRNWTAPLIKSTTTTTTKATTRKTVDVDLNWSSWSDKTDVPVDDNWLRSKTMILIISVCVVGILLCGFVCKKLTRGHSNDIDDPDESECNDLYVIRTEINQESSEPFLSPSSGEHQNNNTDNHEGSNDNEQSHNLPPEYDHVVLETPRDTETSGSNAYPCFNVEGNENPSQIETSEANVSTGHLDNYRDSFINIESRNANEYNGSRPYTIQLENGGGCNEIQHQTDTMPPPPSYEEACKYNV